MYLPSLKDALAQAGLASFVIVGAGALSVPVAHAAPTIVTFAPSVVVSSAPNFTADKLNLIDFSRVDLGSTTSAGTSFTESGVLQVNNASLNNITFNPTGNGSDYSLYITFSATGVQSASSFNSASTGTLNTLNYTLYEAPGVATYGINPLNQPFVAPAGTATALATGSLIAGSTSFSSAPLGAGANVQASFAEALAGFILSPANSTLQLFGAFNNNSQIVTVLNSGTAFTLNGGGGDLSFSASANPIPEPISLALLGTSLIGLGLLRRNKAN